MADQTPSSVPIGLQGGGAPQSVQPAPANGVDPNVILPPSVILARQRADAAHTAAYTTQSTSSSSAPAPSPAAPASSSTPAPPEELPETNPDGSVNWENRFKALKGRYDADTRRSRETLDQFEQRMQQMQREIYQAQQPPLPGSGEIPQLVSEKEVADFGPDLIDVVKRAAQEAILPMLKPLASEIGTMKARVDTTENEASRQFLNRMHGTMDTYVPGWQELNKDPNFIAWTKQNDVYSGLNRQEMLQKAWYAGDSNRVVAFFRGFLAEEAAIDPAAATARQQAYAGQGGHVAPNGGGPASPTPQYAPRVSLEQLAAPGRARVATEVPNGKPVWTAAGISQFYMDVANGKFRGRDQERVATEQDLMNAQREGRIVVNPRTATTISG